MSEYIIRETGYPGTIKTETVGELVRCMDCKYASNSQMYCTYFVNEMVEITEDDFCSWGRRKDNA